MYHLRALLLVPEVFKEALFFHWGALLSANLLTIKSIYFFSVQPPQHRNDDGSDDGW